MDIVGSLQDLWRGGDSVSRATALLLLTMSLASWGIILWKLPSFWGALARLERDIALLWSAPSARELAATTRAPGLLGELSAAFSRLAQQGSSGALPAASAARQALRMALHKTTRELQFGLTALASIGATAPFVGLFGTVWGIYHALIAIGAEGQATLEHIAAPVGEALIMTAAGLAVAIPAVLAYNVLTRRAALLLQELDGVAHDLCELALSLDAPSGKANTTVPAAKP